MAEFFIDEEPSVDANKFFVDESANVPSVFEHPIDALTSMDWWTTRPSGEKISTQQAVAGPLISALNGLTPSLGDEIAAGGTTILDSILGGSNTYEDNLAQARGVQSDFAKSSPVINTALQLAGGLKMPLPNVLSKAPGVVPALGNVAKAGGLGAGIGAAYGFGAGEGQDRLDEAAKGGLLGLVLGGGVQSIAEPLQGGYSIVKDLLTQTGRTEAAQQGARNVIKNFVENPEDITKALKNAATEEAKIPFIQRQGEDYLGNYKRTAELAGIPGVGALEQSVLRTSPEAATIADSMNVARESARQRIFSKAAGQVEGDSVLGEKIRKGLIENSQKAGEKVNTLADKAFIGGEEIKTFPTKVVISDALHAYTKSGARDVSSEFKTLVNNFRALPKKVDLKTLQDYRSSFGTFADMGGVGSTTVDKMTAGIARRMRSSVDSGIEKALANGEISTSQANAYRGMLKARAQKGATFEQGAVGDVLEKKPFNSGFEVPGESVGAKFIRTEEDAKQAISALTGKKESVDSVRKTLLQNVWETSTNPMTKDFNPTAFHRQLNKISKVDDVILTKPQKNVLLKIGQDLKNEAAAQKLGSKLSKGQSATSQFNSQLDLLTSSMKLEATGAVEKGLNAVSPILGRAFKVASSVIFDPAERQQAIAKELSKFVLNKQNAIDLLKGGNPKSKWSVLPRFYNQLTESIAKGTFAAAQKQPTKKKEVTMTTEDKKPLAPTEVSAKRVLTAKEIIPALKKQESNGNPNAVSNVGAIGLTQIMPETGKQIAKELKLASYDLKDPKTNEMMGEYYLQKLIDKFKDHKLGLTAYHSGPGTVEKLLKESGGSTLEDILNFKAKDGTKLGPVGRAYALQVIKRLGNKDYKLV